MGAFSRSMPGARPIVLALLAVASAAACAGASTSPGSGPSNGAAWSELRISWSFGPCPDDGRSCHQTLTVKPDGGFIAAETPNAPGSGGTAEPVRRFAALAPQEVRELHRVVDAPGFADKVGSFGCPPEYDATVRIELEGPWGVRSEEVGGCVHASDTKPNAPRALVQMLEHHRWSARDARPAASPPPTGEGDPCTASVGCGKGLVCAVAPCVVAPCVSGSCQKSGP